MKVKGPNRPFVVWASCFLWLTSFFSITWSLLLFFCVGDMLVITGTDLVNAFVLLSGIIMLPTNVYMLCSISNGKKIDHKAKVLCCPLWLCILWIILINVVGVILCIQKIYLCHDTLDKRISNGMKHYRNIPKYKHFMDTLQWSLGCCGLNSYKDWFTHDWYDKIRDYEWNPHKNKRNAQSSTEINVVDSVPLSCCKSGSCISNYLMELGTNSINTKGCGNLMYHIVTMSMNAHLVMFLSIIIVEVLILKCIINKEKAYVRSKRNNLNVRHLMPVKDNFDVSSGSCQLNPDDSEDTEGSLQVESVKMDIYKGVGIEQQHMYEDYSKERDKASSQNLKDLVVGNVDLLQVVMVFLSVVNWVRCRGPDEFWRKRRIFRLAAHYIGRRRNCYSVAVRNVHRALVYATKARKLKKQDMKELWNTRITAACEQHNITHFTLKEGLDRANIMLDRKSLSDLASWEPRTFECLAAIAKRKLDIDGFIDGADKKQPTGINLNLKDVMLEALKEKKN